MGRPHPPQPTVDQPSSSQSVLAQPIHPPPSPPSPPLVRRPTVDKPGSSYSLSKAPSRPLAEGAWEGREGENILLEAPRTLYWSHEPRNKDPDEMRQCDLRIFELVNDRYSIPTRRIAIRSHELEEQCASYCKTRRIVDIIGTRIMLIAREQGCLWITYMSRSRIGTSRYRGRLVLTWWKRAKVIEPPSNA